jgi:hypothetical protein
LFIEMLGFSKTLLGTLLWALSFRRHKG